MSVQGLPPSMQMMAACNFPATCALFRQSALSPPYKGAMICARRLQRGRGGGPEHASTAGPFRKDFMALALLMALALAGQAAPAGADQPLSASTPAPAAAAPSTPEAREAIEDVIPEGAPPD